MKKLIGKLGLRLGGWTTVNEAPKDLGNAVCIMAPHTAIEDFFIGKAVFLGFPGNAAGRPSVSVIGKESVVVEIVLRFRLRNDDLAVFDALGNLRQGVVANLRVEIVQEFLKMFDVCH